MISMRKFRTPDAVIAGAGFSGMTLARALAEKGVKVLVLEKRDHIAGNAYDEKDEQTGLTVHRYGPHIFHTRDKAVFDFLSRFTDWNGYEHKVLANIYGKFMPVPFNLDSGNESQGFGTKAVGTVRREYERFHFGAVKNRRQRSS